MPEYDILIGIEFSTICNINCDYCYARDNYKLDWQKEISNNNFNKLYLFLDNLTKSQKVKIVLLGGEPSQSKYFKQILELRNKLVIEIYTNLIKMEDLIFHKNITYTVSFHSQYMDKIEKNLDILFKRKVQNVNIDLMLSKTFKPSHKFLNMEDKLNKYSTIFNIRLEVIESMTQSNFLVDIQDSVLFFNKLFQKFDNKYYYNFKKIYQHNVICNMIEFNLDFYGNLKQVCSNKKIGNIFTENLDTFFDNFKTSILCKKGTTCPCNNLLQTTHKKILKEK